MIEGYRLLEKKKGKASTMEENHERILLLFTFRILLGSSLLIGVFMAGPRHIQAEPTYSMGRGIAGLSPAYLVNRAGLGRAVLFY